MVRAVVDGGGAGAGRATGLVLELPGDPRFVDLVRTAARIMVRALPGGELLLDGIHATVGAAVAAVFTDAEDHVTVELRTVAGQLELVLSSGHGRSVHRFPPSPR